MARSLALGLGLRSSSLVINYAPPPQDFTYSHAAPPTTDTGINYVSDFTISMWVDFTEADAPGFLFNYFSSLASGFGLQVLADGTLEVFNDIVNADQPVATGLQLTEGLHHVAFLFDNFEPRDFRIVIDNDLDSGWINYGTSSPFDNSLFFGQRGNGSLQWGGTITNVKVYDGIRSDSVIASLYHEFD